MLMVLATWVIEAVLAIAISSLTGGIGMSGPEILVAVLIGISVGSASGFHRRTILVRS
jgi:hypothetical protein